MKPIEMMALFLRTEAFARQHNRMNVAEWARKQYRKYRSMYTAGWGDPDVRRTA